MHMERNVHARIITFIAAVLFSITAMAQESFSQALDNLYTGQQLTGNALATLHDNLVYKRSFGNHDAISTPNTDSSVFSMASVTKIFTATAILQLKEKGALNLDDLYVKYVPDFPFNNITIRQLLSHTSGLPSYEVFDSADRANPAKTFANADALPALKKWDKPLLCKPGEEWHYSSINYALLAALVEKLSGMSLQDCFGKYIFAPAGMQCSHLENRMDGLVSTTDDMAEFDNAYFSAKLISLASMKEAMTPVKLKNGESAITGTLLGSGIAGYGLGWYVGIQPMLGMVVWHAGNRPDVSAIYAHDISKDEAVFIFENVPAKGIDVLAATTLKMMNGLPDMAER